MARVSGEAMAEVRGEDQGLGFRIRVSDIGEGESEKGVYCVSGLDVIRVVVYVG